MTRSLRKLPEGERSLPEIVSKSKGCMGRTYFGKMSFESMSRPLMRFGGRIQIYSIVPIYKIELPNSHEVSSFQNEIQTLKLHRWIY